MVRGVLASRLGMQWEQSRMDSIADNLANLNTAGYQRTIALGGEFGQMLLRRMQSSTDPKTVGRLGQGARLEQVVRDRTQGTAEVTGRPLDITLIGPGEFVYQTPGGVGYTRQGEFRRDAAGRLVTAQGYPVLVGGAPVGLGARELTLTNQGEVILDGSSAGRLDIRGGNRNTSLAVGSLERSNVDLTLEMTDMIAGLRAFQANQRLLQVQDETLAKAAELGRL